MDEIAAKLESRLRAQLPFVDAGAALGPDTDLRDLGLDSMVAIDLLLDLEESFGITFPDEAIRADTFRTPRSLERRIRALMEAAGAAEDGRPPAG
jgi:acyl carrier protein